MRKLLVSSIALFCVSFLHAQENTVNKKLTNEEYFNQAELVFEGFFIRTLHTYNFHGRRDDSYGIDAIKVRRVLKGDQSLTDSVIYRVFLGTDLGFETYYDERWDTVGNAYFYTPPASFSGSYELLKANGIPGKTSIHNYSVFFLKSSELPEDENSKYFAEKKYQDLEQALVWAQISPFSYNKLFICRDEDKVIGLDSLVFHSKVDFYNYIKQFEGYTVPPPPPQEPMIKAISADEAKATLDPERYEEMLALRDYMYNIIEKEKEKEKLSKKKIAPKPKGNPQNPKLNLLISKPEKIKEGGKWYVKFSIWACCDAPNTYLVQTGLNITFDNSVFGNLTLSKITASLSNYFKVPGNDYTVYTFEPMSNSFSINLLTNNLSATKAAVPDSPIAFLDIKIEALNSSSASPSCVSFPFSQIDNVSKYTLSSNATTSYFYDKTYYFNYMGAPVFSNFSHTSRIAGVGDVLTINGSNFGTQRGTILFKTADDGGLTYLKGLDKQYIKDGDWNNTQIKVKIPSLVYKGYPLQIPSLR